MLTAVERDQRWPDVVAGITQRVFQHLLSLYNKSLNDWSLGEQRVLFPSNLSVLRFEGNKIHCSPLDQPLTVQYGPFDPYDPFGPINSVFMITSIILF